MTRRAHLAVLSTLLVCLAALAIPVHAQDDAAKVLPGLEKALWEAWKSHDVKPFEQHLAENAVNVTGSGIEIGKAKNVEMIKTSDCKVAGYTLGDITVTKVSDSTAVLTYSASQDATCGGNKLPAKVQVSTVWVKQGGKWLNALYHESPAPM